MDNQLTTAALLAENEIAEMNKEIKPLARDYKQLKERIESMAVFTDRSSAKGALKERAKVEYLSTPEEELFFEHRRYYEELTATVQTLGTCLKNIKPSSDTIKDYGRLLNNIRVIEGKASKHLDEMRAILADLRKQLTDKEHKMIAILQERARLVQSAIQHKDKMELARDTAVPTGDLLQRLAMKYGTSVDDVKRMIAAKPALVEEMEAAQAHEQP